MRKRRRDISESASMSPLVRKLVELTDKQGICDMEMQRRMGVCEGSMYAWRTGKAYPSARSIEAWVEELGCEIVLRSKI